MSNNKGQNTNPQDAANPANDYVSTLRQLTDYFAKVYTEQRELAISEGMDVKVFDEKFLAWERDKIKQLAEESGVISCGKTSDPSEKHNNGNVGYKKPPKEHQFKKGQSGNPKGRHKTLKPKNIHEWIIYMLDGNIGTTINMPSEDMTGAQTIALRLMEKAANGNVSAMNKVYGDYKNINTKEYINNEIRKKAETIQANKKEPEMSQAEKKRNRN